MTAGHTCIWTARVEPRYRVGRSTPCPTIWLGVRHEGAFPTSEESDAILAEAHATAADFLGAESASEVAFGQNMTTITFAVSRAIGRTLHPGDEIVVTRLDHDANVAPWLALEEERGAIVRWVEIRPDDCTLDMAGFERVLSAKTRLVAVGLASNAVGTINPIGRIVETAHAAGAWTYVDAVHAAPHVAIDVAAVGNVHFLVCSPYKFFGPHLGLLYGRRELLERLAPYKVRPATRRHSGQLGDGDASGNLSRRIAGYIRIPGAARARVRRSGRRHEPAGERH